MENPNKMSQHHALITFNNQDDLDDHLNGIMHSADATGRWVALTGTNWGNEFLAITADVFTIIADQTLEAISDRTDPGNWPPLPFNKWNEHDRRELVRLAVTEWNYAGPLGVDADRAYKAFTLGKLANIGKTP